jgi:hypothetical protein
MYASGLLGMISWSAEEPSVGIVKFQLQFSTDIFIIFAALEYNSC